MTDHPYIFYVRRPSGQPSHYDTPIRRRLSALEGQFADQQAYAAILSRDDSVLYDVYDLARPAVAGEWPHRTSSVYLGMVGDEYVMTKGYVRAALATAELYSYGRGWGVMALETPDGAWAIEDLQPGAILQPEAILHMPPRWARRSVNTSPDADLVTVFAYPGKAEHDGTIEQQASANASSTRGVNPWSSINHCGASRPRPRGAQEHDMSGTARPPAARRVDRRHR